MKLLLILLFLTLSDSTYAVSSEVGLFHRCYMHLTQTYPAPGNSLLDQVKRGTRSAVDACNNILERVSFSADNGTMIPDENDMDAVNVLRVFHNLHYSWFATRFYPEIQDNYIRNMQNLYDASTPALYFTRAMFAPEVSFESIFRGDDTLLSVRRTRERTNSIFQAHPSSTDILQGITFTGLGDLLGIRKMDKDVVVDVVLTPNFVGTAGSVNINTHWGGGVLGSQVYLIQNIQANSLEHRSDGGVNANRKWSRSVFNDFFCRELPVVRSTDVDHYIAPASPLTYRNSRSCVQCHASLDPMAGIVRDARYVRRGHFNDPNGAYAFLLKWDKTMPAANYFPVSADSNYHRRPTDGNFYMRTLHGELISRELSSLEELGNEFLKTDDLYVCAAKRYFEYFTGIKADISDIKDPMNANFPSLSVDQQKYRQIVIDLGLSLKSHKNLKQLVKDIISSPSYRRNGNDAQH